MAKKAHASAIHNDTYSVVVDLGDADTHVWDDLPWDLRPERVEVTFRNLTPAQVKELARTLVSGWDGLTVRQESSHRKVFSGDPLTYLTGGRHAS
jgi:hypothetical protein